MKSYAWHSHRNFLAWIVFSIGIAVEPLACFVFFLLGGSVFDSGDDDTAQIVQQFISAISFMLCMLAPFFSVGSLRQKCLLSILGFFAASIVALVCFRLFTIIYRTL
jgi:hypothetical protein